MESLPPPPSHFPPTDCGAANMKYLSDSPHEAIPKDGVFSLSPTQRTSLQAILDGFMKQSKPVGEIKALIYNGKEAGGFGVMGCRGSRWGQFTPFVQGKCKVVSFMIQLPSSIKLARHWWQQHA